MAEFAIQELSAISECAVCLSSATNPKVLPCQHTFCLACLQGVYGQAIKRDPLTTGQLSCPVCITVSPILAGDLTQLPSDFRTNQVASVIDTLQKATLGSKCFVCSRKKVDSDAQVLCFDCVATFCNDCHETHITNKRFKDHIFTVAPPNELGKLRCTEHNEFYQNFCMDCSTGICKTCMLIAHTGHRIELFIKSDGKSYHENADTARAELELKRLVDEYTSIRQKYELHIKTTKGSIRQHKLDLIKTIEDQETQLFIKLDRDQTTFRDRLDELTSSVKNSSARLGELQHESKIIARPFPMATGIKLAADDPCVQYTTECMKRVYTFPSPPQHKFTTADVNIGILSENKSMSENPHYLDKELASTRELQLPAGTTHDVAKQPHGSTLWLDAQDHILTGPSNQQEIGKSSSGPGPTLPTCISGRGSQSGGSRGSQQSYDGWTPVKTTRAPSIDPAKLKITQHTMDENNISLGRPRGFSTWGRGSSGGTKQASKESERASGPGNRNIMTNRRTSRSRVAGGSRNQSRDNSRNRSSRDNSRNRGPSRGRSADKRPSRTVQELPFEEIEKKSRALIDEYLHINDLKEALQCLTELESPQSIHLSVGAILTHVLERSDKARNMSSHLLHEAIKQNVITPDNYSQGLITVLEYADDMAIDIPQIWKYLGGLIGPMIEDGVWHVSNLKVACTVLVPFNKAGVLVAHVLHDAAHRLGSLKVAEIWRVAKMSWSDFLPSTENLTDFLSREKLEFTVEDEPPKSPEASTMPIDIVQKGLDNLINDKEAHNGMVFDWINANVLETRTREPAFIRALMSVVCQSAIVGQVTSCKVKSERMKKRCILLQRYLDHDAKLELQALYALQALVHKLENPPEVLRVFFDTLYDEDIISEDVFYQWEGSKDPAEQAGKGVAVSSVVPFFTWLREAEEDDPEDANK